MQNVANNDFWWLAALIIGSAFLVFDLLACWASLRLNRGAVAIKKTRIKIILDSILVIIPIVILLISRMEGR